MRIKGMIGGACVVAVLIAGLAPQAAAQTTNDRRTFFTFSGPIELPGVTLPAGKYMFRIADPQGSRKMIQVVSADGKKPHGMFFSGLVQRAEPAHDPEVRFMEAAAGTPPAIRTVWYAGERDGFEFIYPREQALRLARSTGAPVLTTRSQTTTAAQTNTGDLDRVSSTGSSAAAPATTEIEREPSGRAEQGEVASASIDVPEQTVAANESPRTQLPRTASAGPVVGFVGVGLLLAATIMCLRRTPRF